MQEKIGKDGRPLEKPPDKRTAYRQSIAAFYQELQEDNNPFRSSLQDGTSATPIESKALPMSSAHIAVADEKQLRACEMRFAAQTAQITEAIEKRDLKTLGAILGPPVYLMRQKFIKLFISNEARWLHYRTKLELEQLKGGIILAYLVKEKIPYTKWEGLNSQQKVELQKLLEKGLKNAIHRLMTATDFNSPIDVPDTKLRRAVIAELIPILEQQLKTISRVHEGAGEGTYGTLFMLKDRCNAALEGCKNYALRQRVPNFWSAYLQDMFSANDEPWIERWKKLDFAMSTDFPAPGVSQDKNPPLAIAENGLASIKAAADFFDEALFNYLSTPNEQARLASLGIIEMFLHHGGRPSADLASKLTKNSQTLDWSVIGLILKNLNPPTIFSQKVCDQLLLYYESLQGLSGWLRGVSSNPEINEQRKRHVQSLILLLCKPELQDGTLDLALFKAIETVRKDAIDVDNSALFRGLNAAIGDRRSGPLVRGLARGEVELREQMLIPQRIHAPADNLSVFSSRKAPAASAAAAQDRHPGAAPQ